MGGALRRCNGGVVVLKAGKGLHVLVGGKEVLEVTKVMVVVVGAIVLVVRS